MAVNKPPGDNSRMGALRKRSQLKTKVEAEHWTGRKKTGQFMEDAKARPFKGVREDN